MKYLFMRTQKKIGFGPNIDIFVFSSLKILPFDFLKLLDFASLILLKLDKTKEDEDD